MPKRDEYAKIEIRMQDFVKDCYLKEIGKEIPHQKVFQHRMQDKLYFDFRKNSVTTELHITYLLVIMEYLVNTYSSYIYSPILLNTVVQTLDGVLYTKKSLNVILMNQKNLL